jgi:hypothetical protein
MLTWPDYGTMLLEHGMAKEARAAFEATLTKEPQRLGAELGAAAAAESAGDVEKARAHYTAAVALRSRRAVPGARVRSGLGLYPGVCRRVRRRGA